MNDGSDDADALLRAVAAAPARPPPPLGHVTAGELVAGRFVIGSIAREDDAQQVGHNRSAYLGCAYAMIGDLDRAFAIFEDCLAHGDVAIADVMVAPWTEELRDNPRYRAFVAKMRLLD